MYTLRRFHGHRFERVNAIIDSLAGHITSYVNLVGSASLPLPEVGRMQGLPATACRVEGHPRARLFPGTDAIDQAEWLVEHATRDILTLDGTYRISAQPHSATQANQSAFQAVLGGSDGPVCYLAPADGGHISHHFGTPSTATSVAIPVDDAGIDYDELRTVVRRDRPVLMAAGGTSYTRAVDYPRLRAIADEVGCHLHADLAHTAPFVAVGQHPPAFPFAHSATLDTSKNLRGPRGGVLIYGERDATAMERAIFPRLQSSPNQNALLAKAACLSHWLHVDLEPYATRMVRLARLLGEQLAPTLGDPIYGGTDTHLLLFDVAAIGLDGRQAEELLADAGILVNRNQVPGDPRPPWAPSGVRLGTTAIAILDYRDHDVRELGDAIASVLTGGPGPADTIERLLETYHRPLVNISSERTS
jgi:glycine hydroxymethyltransferase